MITSYTIGFPDYTPSYCFMRTPAFYPASPKAVSKSERKPFSLPTQPIIVLAILSYGKRDFEKVEDRKTKIGEKGMRDIDPQTLRNYKHASDQNRGYFDTENSLTFVDFEGLQIEGQAISNC